MINVYFKYTIYWEMLYIKTHGSELQGYEAVFMHTLGLCNHYNKLQ